MGQSFKQLEDINKILQENIRLMNIFVKKFDELMKMEDKYVAAWDKLLPSVREARKNLPRIEEQ